MMHKNQPGKSVKTKRNKEINYFANIISCLVTQKLTCKTDGAVNELPFAPVQHCTYKVFILENPFRQANRRPKDKYI